MTVEILFGIVGATQPPKFFITLTNPLVCTMERSSKPPFLRAGVATPTWALPQVPRACLLICAHQKVSLQA
jgi:hypothetical protein